MGTITIRNLPDDVVERIKQAARAHGHSMEQEVRETLARRYDDRATVIERVRGRWAALPSNDAETVRHWRDTDRP